MRKNETGILRPKGENNMFHANCIKDISVSGSSFGYIRNVPLLNTCHMRNIT